MDTDADPAIAAAINSFNICPLGYVEIPSGSANGQSPITPSFSPLGFQSVYCGGALGYTTTSGVGNTIVCKGNLPLISLGKWLDLSSQVARVIKSPKTP